MLLVARRVGEGGVDVARLEAWELSDIMMIMMRGVREACGVRCVGGRGVREGIKSHPPCPRKCWFLSVVSVLCVVVVLWSCGSRRRSTKS